MDGCSPDEAVVKPLVEVGPTLTSPFSSSQLELNGPGNPQIDTLFRSQVPNNSILRNMLKCSRKHSQRRHRQTTDDRDSDRDRDERQSDKVTLPGESFKEAPG